jgi:ABC-type spermidine/putrescine transport system permease subunit I
MILLHALRRILWPLTLTALVASSLLVFLCWLTREAPTLR